jgi:hypothetical protein
MMMLSSSIAAVLFVVSPVLPVVVSLVVCLIFVVSLVLSACDQVVLLQIILSLVAWQLEKASKYSTVVYKLSLIIWITSILFQKSHEPDNPIIKCIYLSRSIFYRIFLYIWCLKYMKFIYCNLAFLHSPLVFIRRKCGLMLEW